MHCELVGDDCQRSQRLSSGALLNQRIDAFFLALPACDNAAKSADDADERPAVRARIAFGCTLLILAGSANHGVSFA